MIPARYIPRRSDNPGNPWWYVHDTLTGAEAEWSPEAELACGIPDDCPGYAEPQARAVAGWLNAHDTTNPTDLE